MKEFGTPVRAICPLRIGNLERDSYIKKGTL